MLEQTFKERVRNLIHPRFEECAEKAKADYSKKSAELAARGHLHSGATFTAWQDARLKEKAEHIAIAWEVIREVVSALRVPHSETLANDLKAEVEHYASYRMSGVPPPGIRQGDERLLKQLEDEFEAKRSRALNRTRAEIDLFVDRLRAVAPAQAKEVEQNFGILLSRNQAAIDFVDWAKELGVQNRSIALLFIDIDHFKPLNEKYSHATVDKTVLPQFMMVLKQLAMCRGEAYRYGGEEFLILLPNHDASEAMQFGEKVRDTIGTLKFPIGNDCETLSVSIGVALWPKNGSTYEEILQKANSAEGKAKTKRNMMVMAE